MRVALNYRQGAETRRPLSHPTRPGVGDLVTSVSRYFNINRNDAITVLLSQIQKYRYAFGQKE